jgi:hypothetical protein
MIQAQVESICGNNFTGINSLTLFYAEFIKSNTEAGIEIVNESTHTETKIVFLNNGAEYQELVKESENRPFYEFALSANLGRECQELLSWCERNRRRKFALKLEDKNGLIRYIGSKNYPLSLTFGTASGQADIDRNNRFLSLKGKYPKKSGYSEQIAEPVAPIDPNNYLVTHDRQVFFVTDNNKKITIQ